MNINTLLFLLMTLLGSGCSKDINSTCEELLKAANSQVIMNDAWSKLSVFYDYQYEKLPYTDNNHVFLDTIKNELAIFPDSDFFDAINLDWESLSYLVYVDPLKEIVFKYKENFEENIISGEVMSKTMISRISLGSRGNQVEFNLMSDVNENGYALSVRCESRDGINRKLIGKG